MCSRCLLLSTCIWPPIWVAAAFVGADISAYQSTWLRVKDNVQLRRSMKAALRACDVSNSLGEGLTVREGADARDRAVEFDVFAELGARRINAVSIDPDFERTLDQFAITVEMAAARGMQSSIEFASGLTVADLPTTLRVIQHVNRPKFGLLIDTMHYSRAA